LPSDPGRAERWSYTANQVIASNRYYGGVHTNPRGRAGYMVEAGDHYTDPSALLNVRQLPTNNRMVVGAPFIITESTWTAPMSYLAEAPFLIAAYGALTGLDGYYWFATRAPEYALPGQKFPLANPAILGNFPAAALMYRQGYIRQGRAVVHEERRMRTDTRPSGLLWEVFHSTAFQSHSYRNPVIGWAGDLDNMTREEVLEYFKTFYAPNNAIAAIVGDIDPDKTMAIMEKYFGPLQAQTLPRRSITEEPRQRGERRVTISLDAQPQMHIGYHIPQIGHEDSYALDVLGQLLSGVSRGSRTGRLYKSLVLEKKVALRASAGPMTSLYPSLFVFSATPARGKSSQELEEAIYEEIGKLQQEPPSEEELTRVRNAVDASAIRSLRSNFGIARVIAASEHLAGSWRYVLTEREKMKAVTAEDVQNVAKKYFAEENRTVAELKSKSRQGGAADTPPPATAGRSGDK
ncbi:MAG: insulinase family protein, partial [Acidobacteria bacterium]|nr:insulinase family protein [Acidobacteriota bacterium]